MAAKTKDNKTSENRKAASTRKRTKDPKAPASIDFRAAAALASHVERDELPAKNRIYAVSKMVGITSRQVVDILNQQGLEKKPQSTITKEEVFNFLDYLIDSGKKETTEETTGKTKRAAAPRKSASKKATAKKSTPKKTTSKKTTAKKSASEKDADKSAEPQAEKSRPKNTRSKKSQPEKPQSAAQVPEPEQVDPELAERVRKNVENEFHQIQEKVDSELESSLETDPDSQSNSAESEEDKKGKEKPTRRRKRAVKRTVSQAKHKQQADGPSAEEPEEDELQQRRLEKRVRKNVENEISQIERKVEAELVEPEVSAPAAVESDSEEHPRADQEMTDTGTVNVEQLHEALVEAGDSFDDDFAPVVTPKPETVESEEAAEYAPIFMPPQETPPARTKRRSVRKSPSSQQDYVDADGTEQDALEPDAAEEKSPREKSGRNKSTRNKSSSGKSAQRGNARHDSAQDGATADFEQIEEPKGIRGSTRIEAQRRRRQELREKGRERKHLVSQAEFLARRESVERTMVVREKERTDGGGLVTQVAVLEDNLLVEHFVTSETQSSMIGNIYLGRVQNVLPSMEAAFIDIGQGRNGVLYAGEINWRQMKLGGRSRKIEHALKSGDQILVQVAKDPIGHKGARLTTQISLAGRFLVYVPKGRSAGISRKLPIPERKRLKDILERVMPADGGAIIRTAAENVPEEEIAKDVNRLNNLWEDITKRAEKEKSSKGAKPVTMYEEPNLLVKVVRDLFNEDFTQLVVDGLKSFNTVDSYVQSVAPDLGDRVVKYNRAENGDQDAFEAFQIDEQLHKALSRQVWLPSGGTLVIDRTEAMTVIDVNTGKFTGSGGNLEETVTRNNLEAAEEIVRQMRLRDMGGMIVVDFIDMVLPENQDLVLRRLKEALGRDRTRHEVSEVTSLGLVQMTRKRLGTGLIETFATECEHCHGRGLVIHEYPVDEAEEYSGPGKRNKQSESRKPEKSPAKHPAIVAMTKPDEKEEAAFEDLAESVISVEEESTENDTNSDTTDRKPKRRRGSRGGQRGRASRQEQDNQAHDLGGESTAEKAQDSSQTGSETDAESARGGADSATTAKSGRRRRRVVKKVRPEPESTATEPLAKAAGAKDQKAEQERAERRPVAKGAVREEAQRPALTYEQALAEFEASPRRKRQTRGNSRSDIRPQPEDFEKPAGENTESNAVTESSQSPKVRGKKAQQNHAQKQESSPREESVDTSHKAGGTRKRRVVRKLYKKRASAASAAPEHKETKEPVKAVASTGTEEAHSSRRRGRRRVAVKRNRSRAEQSGAENKAPDTSTEAPAQSQNAAAQSKKAAVDKVKKPANSSRGRRRVVRRSTT